MPPKRASASAEIEETIIKQGCLIKSPPAYIFGKRTSWKGRLIKLCKTLIDSYYIRYYAYDGVTEDWKGDIAVSDIKSIEIGSNTLDKVMVITRLFNNSPKNILCIKTNKRDYYLVDDNEKNIADWHKCITDVWVKINQKENDDGPLIALHAPVTPPSEPTMPRLKRKGGLVDHQTPRCQPANQHVRSHFYEDQAEGMDEATRPKSYPEEHPRTDAAMLNDRQRSHTDPETRRGLPCIAREQRKLSIENPSEELELELSRVTVECKRSPTHSDTIPASYSLKNDFTTLLWQEERDSRISDDTAYSSDPESIYDVPRPVLKSIHLPPESTEDGETSDPETPDQDVYQIMWPVSQDSEENIMDPPSQTQIPPNEQEDVRPQEQNDCSPSKPSQNVKTTDSNRYPTPKGSQLKKAYILKMMYEQDSLDYVKKNLTIPTVHLQKHLGLQEVGERLCVSKWKGPVEIGCLFCHGDHIAEINGFRPENKDFFFQMLNHAIKDEVNLVVIRNKKADVFHLEGCNCKGS